MSNENQVEPTYEFDANGYGPDVVLSPSMAGVLTSVHLIKAEKQDNTTGYLLALKQDVEGDPQVMGVVLSFDQLVQTLAVVGALSPGLLIQASAKADDYIKDIQSAIDTKRAGEKAA